MVTWKRVTHPDDTPTEHVALTTGRPGASGPGTCGPRCPLAAPHRRKRGNLMRSRPLGKTSVRVSEVAMRALDGQARAGKLLYPAVSDWAAWEIAEACTAARLRDWSPFTAVQLRYNLLDRSPERELLPMASASGLPVFAWGPLAEGRLTGKYLTGHTGRATEAGRAYPRAGSDDIVRDVIAISRDISCSPSPAAISWLRQQPGPVIPLIAARTA